MSPHTHTRRDDESATAERERERKRETRSNEDVQLSKIGELSQLSRHCPSQLVVVKVPARDTTRTISTHSQKRRDDENATRERKRERETRSSEDVQTCEFGELSQLSRQWPSQLVVAKGPARETTKTMSPHAHTHDVTTKTRRQRERERETRRPEEEQTH